MAPRPINWAQQLAALVWLSAVEPSRLNMKSGLNILYPCFQDFQEGRKSEPESYGGLGQASESVTRTLGSEDTDTGSDGLGVADGLVDEEEEKEVDFIYNILQPGDWPSTLPSPFAGAAPAQWGDVGEQVSGVGVGGAPCGGGPLQGSYMAAKSVVPPVQLASSIGLPPEPQAVVGFPRQPSELDLSLYADVGGGAHGNELLVGLAAPTSPVVPRLVQGQSRHSGAAVPASTVVARSDVLAAMRDPVTLRLTIAEMMISDAVQDGMPKSALQLTADGAVSAAKGDLVGLPQWVTVAVCDEMGQPCSVDAFWFPGNKGNLV